MSPLVLIRCPAGRHPYGSPTRAATLAPASTVGRETGPSLCHHYDGDESDGRGVRGRASLRCQCWRRKEDRAAGDRPGAPVILTVPVPEAERGVRISSPAAPAKSRGPRWSWSWLP